MKKKQLERMRTGKGFIAALDQSGGSTPRALLQYGVKEDRYQNDDEMFSMVHEMRTRIIKSPSFTSEHILAAILFENTMEREIDGLLTADYLWEEKGIIPILKVDKGLADLEDGVQLMKPIDGLGELLKRGLKRNIFGTKMRSVIKEANEKGIRAIVEQQFAIGKEIASYGLIPILEPEVDIRSPEKDACEQLLKTEIDRQLEILPDDVLIMFKLTIPTEVDLYRDIMADPRVIRIAALSGGYTRREANEKLRQNKGLIASFSRALLEGLKEDQTKEEFDALLKSSVTSVYEASIS
ncbi:MAG: fructose bisphosphate aldolase [Firmicutes bacterium]|nr:fructose bisphosphate aldolase [Bacillota bacterium]